jgi:hypothetical protein
LLNCWPTPAAVDQAKLVTLYNWAGEQRAAIRIQPAQTSSAIWVLYRVEEVHLT